MSHVYVVRFAIRSGVIFSFFCFGAVAAYPQSEVPNSNAMPFGMPSVLTVSKEVQEVSLILTVVDHRGRFVSNLSRSDFTIWDNGELPKRITYFENQTNLPLRVAVVLDTSDSVGQSIHFEQKAAAMFLKHILRPGCDLALIIGFNDEARLLQEPTSDSGLLSNVIRSLRVGGYTAIYDAVSAASQELGKIKDIQQSRRIVIVITDGADNRSHISLQQTAEVAQRNDSFVYIMSTNPSTSNRLDEQDRAMKQRDRRTGGNFLRADSEDQIRNAFSKIDKELRSQYAIGYKPANASPNGLFHHLAVFGPKKLHLFHRQGYFAR